MFQSLDRSKTHNIRRQTKALYAIDIRRRGFSASGAHMLINSGPTANIVSSRFLDDFTHKDIGANVDRKHTHASSTS